MLIVMIRITEELVRKRAEHNEGLIGTLEELSLHQEDIEEVTFLNNGCRNLQILYLQANLIKKIENLNKLKRLRYLNLALNNVELIENLDRCEALEKLDLTLNFIGHIESVTNLMNNYNLQQLFLTGNPCSDFTDYRPYIIATLSQLQVLDGKEITITERLKDQQRFNQIQINVRSDQNSYRIYRQDQIKRVQDKLKEQSNMSNEEFWNSSSENCPEMRREIALRSRQLRNTSDTQMNNEKNIEKVIRTFTKDGERPLNINQAKLTFQLINDDSNKFVLNLHIYRYLDSNLIEIDIQPIFVRITVRGKLFQLVLPEEIAIDQCTVKRSQTTGHLLLELPKVNRDLIIKQNVTKKITQIEPNQNTITNRDETQVMLPQLEYF